jgi:hypothetical protein
MRAREDDATRSIEARHVKGLDGADLEGAVLWGSPTTRPRGASHCSSGPSMESDELAVSFSTTERLCRTAAAW